MVPLGIVVLFKRPTSKSLGYRSAAKVLPPLPWPTSSWAISTLMALSSPTERFSAKKTSLSGGELRMRPVWLGGECNVWGMRLFCCYTVLFDVSQIQTQNRSDLYSFNDSDSKLSKTVNPIKSTNKELNYTSLICVFYWVVAGLVRLGAQLSSWPSWPSCCFSNETSDNPKQCQRKNGNPVPGVTSRAGRWGRQGLGIEMCLSTCGVLRSFCMYFCAFIWT